MNAVFRHSLIYSLILSLLLPPAAFGAGIEPDPSQGKGPSVTTAPNGVPLVNIKAPSASGLSHNQYKDFNVNSQGAILNNSSKAVSTQLGGIVGANPNLGGKAAKTILNEVTGANRSHIQGYIEVAGQKADVILANPNGITVNGGGFINTNRAMVTTGKPNVDGAGQLRSIDVQQGDVRIEGAGINASNITGFDILSRATEINAEIHANDLTITTGANSYDPSTGRATAQTPAPGSAPTVAVDSTALGGMYAGRITLTSTEKGVGVNLQGLVQSQQDLSITADGNLTVKNAKSGANLTLNAGQGTVTVGNMAVAEGNMQVRGKAVSGDKATLAASKSLSIKTDDSVTLTNESLVSAKETASMESKNVSLSGKSTLQGNNVTLNADLASLAESSILAGNDISLTAGSLIGTGSSIRANRNVAVNAGSLSLSGSPVASMDNLDLPSLPGSLYAGSTLAVTGNFFAFNGGFYGAGSTLDIKGQSVEAKNKAMLYAWDQVALEAVDIRLTDATVKSSAAASVSGGNLSLEGGSITASGLLGLQMTGDVSLDGSGGLFGYSGLSAVARNLTNRGIIFSGWDLGLYIEDTLTNTGGADILARGNMLFAGTDGQTRMAKLNNEASTIESLGGDIVIRADLLRNTGTEYP